MSRRILGFGFDELKFLLVRPVSIPMSLFPSRLQLKWQSMFTFQITQYCLSSLHSPPSRSRFPLTECNTASILMRRKILQIFIILSFQRYEWIVYTMLTLGGRFRAMNKQNKYYSFFVVMLTKKKRFSTFLTVLMPLRYWLLSFVYSFLHFILNTYLRTFLIF